MAFLRLWLRGLETSSRSARGFIVFSCFLSAWAFLIIGIHQLRPFVYALTLFGGFLTVQLIIEWCERTFWTND